MNALSNPFFVVFAIFVVNQVTGASLPRVSRETEKYTTKYDHFDVEGILKSRRLVLNYVQCLLDKKPCSPEGRTLKTYLPDALASNCSKCSDIQKKQAGKVFSHLLLNFKPEWDLLIAKYDPDGNFRKMYEIDEDNNDDYSDLDEAK